MSSSVCLSELPLARSTLCFRIPPPCRWKTGTAMVMSTGTGRDTFLQIFLCVFRCEVCMYTADFCESSSAIPLSLRLPQLLSPFRLLLLFFGKQKKRETWLPWIHGFRERESFFVVSIRVVLLIARRDFSPSRPVTSFTPPLILKFSSPHRQSIRIFPLVSRTLLRSRSPKNRKTRLQGAVQNFPP